MVFVHMQTEHDLAARRSRGSCVCKWRTDGFKLGKITFALSAVLAKEVACPGQVAKKVGYWQIGKSSESYWKN